MMGTTIADLEVRIGADSNQFKQELQKVETQVGKAFNVNPINEFSTSVDSVTGRVGSLVSKFTAIAGIMAGGFGLTSMIEGSVKAGEAVYQLSQRYQITTKEASEMNRILKITGSDADTAAKTIMRLDKALSGNSNEGKKAQETLKLFGVSLTDANGKMLPINQQLEELAKGYKAAADAGYGQEYVMNTLGVRGLALISVLQNYNEAAEVASKVKGIGLNPEEMHKASLQLKEMELQFGQLKLASGAAITPLVMELLPQLLPYLQESAVWINKNKNEIASTAKTLVQIVALYESIKIAKKAAAAVNAVVSTVKNSQSPMGLDTAELTRAQEAQINKALRDNERVYAQMRREAIKTANQQKLSAEETSAFLAQEFSKISIKATQSAEQIRAAMTIGFQGVRAEAAESSIAVNRSILSTGVAAEESANLHVASNVRKVESDMAVVASQGKVGVAATVAGTKAVEASSTATAAATANIEKNAVLAASYEGVGVRATTAGAVAVSAAGRAMGAVTTLTRAVWALAGGWLGVAAAVGFALYSMGQANKAEAEFQHANEDFEDFGVKYTCFLMPEEYQNVEIIARNIYAWLFYDVAYKRLEDSYERGYYRLAYCGQSVSVEEITRGLLGKLEIELTCKPYKFAYNGERTITLTKAGTLYNTEGFTAKPYMKIYGSGNVTIYINARAHSFAGIQSYIEVDSELMNAYKGDELQNNKMTSTLFPKLAAGQNNISWSGNVTKIEIIPRWCCL